MTKDSAPAGQTLRQLEAEREKDKALLATLQKRIEAQAQQLARQQEQLAFIQGSMGDLKAQAAQSPRSEIDLLKDELARITKDWKNARWQDTLDGLQTENKRLSEIVQRMEKSVADLRRESHELGQMLSLLEEKQRSGQQHAAEAKVSTTELAKRTGDLDAKLAILEKTLMEERSLEQEARQALQQVRVDESQRQQQVAKWEKLVTEIRQEIAHMQEEKQQMMLQYQRTSPALEGLQTFRESMETRQNEVAETQRLAEGQYKRQWEEWEARVAQEDRRRVLEADEQWKHQGRLNAGLEGRLGALEERMLQQQRHLAALCEQWADQAQQTMDGLKKQLQIARGISQALSEK